MKLIPTTQGKFAKVDDEDYDKLVKLKWQIGRGYAIHSTSKNYRTVTTFMHRVVMDAPPGTIVDHINHDGLDNRKENLRLANAYQNSWNALPNKRGSSRYKGVRWHTRDRRWEAQIRVYKKRTSIGYFGSEIEAARAYDKKAAEVFGEFAYLNNV